MDNKVLPVDRFMENQAKRAENLDPVNEVFTQRSEENLVNFEDELVSDAVESKTPGDMAVDEFSENLKSNIEQNLELEQP